MTTLWIEIALEKGKYDAAAALVLRNTVRDKIAAASLGNMVGGGVSLNGSSCDLEVSCNDPTATERFVRTLLNELYPNNAVSFSTRQADLTHARVGESWTKKALIGAAGLAVAALMIWLKRRLTGRW